MRPTINQKLLINAIKRSIPNWITTNDIKSPAHYELCECELNSTISERTFMDRGLQYNRDKIAEALRNVFNVIKHCE